MEGIYASYANSLKALANEARKVVVNTPGIKYEPSAKKVYANEVASLTASLMLAQKNAPLERNARAISNAKVAAKKESNPNLDDDDLKRINNVELVKARLITGAKKNPITINQKEWEAIQSGAITSSTLSQILDNTNLTVIKQYATPRTAKPVMSPSTVTRAQAMSASGFTQIEIADQLGVSTGAISAALKPPT